MIVSLFLIDQLPLKCNLTQGKKDAEKNALLARRKVAVRVVLRRHAHGRVDGRWRGGAVRGAGWARVVLRAAPAEAHARVADRVALHLVDGHLSSSMALNELDKATSLAWRNLDVSNLAEALEEGAELVFGNVAGKAADEDSGVVGVGELVFLFRRSKCQERGFDNTV